MVEAVVCGHKPGPIPHFQLASSQLKEPVLLVQVEEGMGQTIPIILRNIEGLIPDAVI